jgi:hypothetical protein
MGRIRGVLKWNAMQDFGWAIAETGQVFYVRRKNFRHLPTVQLRHGLEVEFSKPAINVDFLKRLFEGKARDSFSGSHRNPRPPRYARPNGDSRKNPMAMDIVLVEGGPSHVPVTTAVEI